VTTSSEALIKERQTTDIVLVSAQLQYVTVYTSNKRSNCEKAKAYKISIPF